MIVEENYNDDSFISESTVTEAEHAKKYFVCNDIKSSLPAEKPDSELKNAPHQKQSTGMTSPTTLPHALDKYSNEDGDSYSSGFDTDDDDDDDDDDEKANNNIPDENSKLISISDKEISDDNDGKSLKLQAGKSLDHTDEQLDTEIKKLYTSLAECHLLQQGSCSSQNKYVDLVESQKDIVDCSKSQQCYNINCTKSQQCYNIHCNKSKNTRKKVSFEFPLTKEMYVGKNAQENEAHHNKNPPLVSIDFLTEDDPIESVNDFLINTQDPALLDSLVASQGHHPKEQIFLPNNVPKIESNDKSLNSLDDIENKQLGTVNKDTEDKKYNFGNDEYKTESIIGAISNHDAIVCMQSYESTFEQADSVFQKSGYSTDSTSTKTSIQEKKQATAFSGGEDTNGIGINLDMQYGIVDGRQEQEMIPENKIIVVEDKVTFEIHEENVDQSFELSFDTYDEEKLTRSNDIHSTVKCAGRFQDKKNHKDETMKFTLLSMEFDGKNQLQYNDPLGVELTNQLMLIKRNVAEIKKRITKVDDKDAGKFQVKRKHKDDNLTHILSSMEFDEKSRLQHNDPLYIKLANQFMLIKRNVTEIIERIRVDDNNNTKKHAGRFQDKKNHKDKNMKHTLSSMEFDGKNRLQRDDPLDVELTNHIKRNDTEITISTQSSNTQRKKGNSTIRLKKNSQLGIEENNPKKVVDSKSNEALSKDAAQNKEKINSKSAFEKPLSRNRKIAASSKNMISKVEEKKRFNVQITHDSNNEFDYRKVNPKKKKRKKKDKNAAFVKRMVNYEKQKQNKIKKAQLEALYVIKVDKKKCRKCFKVQTFDEAFYNKTICGDCGIIYSIPTKFDAKKFESRHKHSSKNREDTISKIKAERQNSIHESSELQKRLSKGKKGSIVNKKRILTKEEEALFIKRMSNTSKREDQQKRKSNANGTKNNSSNRQRTLSTKETELFFDRMVKSENQKQSNIQRARMKSLYNGKVDKKRCPNCGNEQTYEEFQANQNVCMKDQCQKADDESNGFEYDSIKKFDINEFEKHIQEYCTRKAHNLSMIEAEEILLCFETQQPKSRRQVELADQMSKTGKNFMGRMNHDISVRKNKLRNLNDIQLKQLKVTCTFKPKLKISKNVLRKREKVAR